MIKVILCPVHDLDDKVADCYHTASNLVYCEASEHGDKTLTYPEVLKILQDEGYKVHHTSIDKYDRLVTIMIKEQANGRG
jgi:hypothetical protein